MARPKKARTLDRRISVRVSEETHEAYERVATAFQIPVGQLLRQVLSLEVAELELLVKALQAQQSERSFALYGRRISIGETELIAQMREGGAIGGGLTARLRQEALRQAAPSRPTLTP